jgi:hypothetical protein
MVGEEPDPGRDPAGDGPDPGSLARIRAWLDDAQRHWSWLEKSRSKPKPRPRVWSANSQIPAEIQPGMGRISPVWLGSSVAGWRPAPLAVMEKSRSKPETPNRQFGETSGYGTRWSSVRRVVRPRIKGVFCPASRPATSGLEIMDFVTRAFSSLSICHISM